MVLYVDDPGEDMDAPPKLDTGSGDVVSLRVPGVLAPASAATVSGQSSDRNSKYQPCTNPVCRSPLLSPGWHLYSMW